jgi:hypothetical protein
MLRLQPLCFLTAGLLASACPWSLSAQTPTEQARELEKRLPAPKPPQGRDSFELSEARQQRLQKLLPNAWRKLSQREPLHILALVGEREMQVWSEVKDAGVLSTFPAYFSRELANQFFYTGGIYEAGKNAGADVLAPSLTIRALSTEGGIVDTAAMLGSVARQSPVDLVLICHGLAEAESGMSPQAFVTATRQAVEAAGALKADVILSAPWLPMSARPETTLGITAPISDVLRELAEEEGWLFADLGDITRLLDLPPSDARDDAQKFDRFITTYRSLFYETQDGVFLPRPGLHARLGSALFQSMLDGTANVPWSIDAPHANWRENGAALEVRFTLINPSQQSQSFTLLPLIAGDWKPRELQPEITLAAGAKQTLTIQYARSSGASLPAEESVSRLPVLIISGKRASIVTLRAPLQPAAIVWSSDTLFNQEQRFVAGGQIVNTSQENLSGTWQAEFLGTPLNGKFELKPGAAHPLDLSFDLPQNGPPVSRSPLKLSLTTSGLTLTSTREITLARNLGLNQPQPLTPASESTGKVSLEVKADPSRLTLICDVIGDEMLLDAVSAGAAAWQLDVNLDARSYGKRLEAGSTAPLRVTGSATPGKGHVHDISPWAFGSGYSAAFAAKEFQATHTTSGAGRHQIQLTIPRSYLYLHEWALDNGNSQFGLNVRLTLNTAQGYRTWSLVPTAKSANDAGAMAALELSAKPTQRASVIFD